MTITEQCSSAFSRRPSPRSTGVRFRKPGIQRSTVPHKRKRRAKEHLGRAGTGGSERSRACNSTRPERSAGCLCRRPHRENERIASRGRRGRRAARTAFAARAKDRAGVFETAQRIAKERVHRRRRARAGARAAADARNPTQTRRGCPEKARAHVAAALAQARYALSLPERPRHATAGNAGMLISTATTARSMISRCANATCGQAFAPGALPERGDVAKPQTAQPTVGPAAARPRTARGCIVHFERRRRAHALHARQLVFASRWRAGRCARAANARLHRRQPRSRATED